MGAADKAMLERALSRDNAVHSHLRGVYTHLSEVDNFDLLIDLNQLNIFVYAQDGSDGDSERWRALVIGPKESYFIDCLRGHIAPIAQYVLSTYASNGFKRLPDKAVIAGGSERLMALSAHLLIYYLDRVCNMKRAALSFTNNLRANESALKSWWRASKYARSD